MKIFPDAPRAIFALTGALDHARIQGPGTEQERVLGLIAEDIHVLLIEDNPDYAHILQLILSREKDPRFIVTHTDHLERGLSLIKANSYQLILLDLSLPETGGLDTFRRVSVFAYDTPIVILTVLDDAELANAAVREGAQDYLIKGELQAARLVRSLQYALERHRTMSRLQHLSMVDDLTGLLNRRGFMNIGRQHLKIAQRACRSILVFFLDLDGLKQINDQRGHQEGDRALRTVANLMRTTFRSSDILARLGGDEFTAMAIDVEGKGAAIGARLCAHLEEHNLAHPEFPIAISFGAARYDPATKPTLEELLEQADQRLYRVKRARHARLR